MAPLAPDQSKKFKVDRKFTAAETVIVEVTIICNPPNNCAELNSANNRIRRCWVRTKRRPLWQCMGETGG